MNRLPLTLLPVALLIGLHLSSPQGRASEGGFSPPPELKKVHFIVALDTDSDLCDGLRKDEHRLVSTLTENVPPSRHTLTLFTGPKLTRGNILKHLSTMKVQPDEGIVFYYGGHGAEDPVLDPTRGHFFQLTHAPVLPRAEVRQAMEARKAPLTVIMTDCCSSLSKMPRVKPKGIGTPATQLHPTFKCLFFQARGTIDVTAAADKTPSWGDDSDGGIFTRSLCKMLVKTPRELDRDGDGFVTWREFFPQLQRDTEYTFANWSKVMRARGENIPASTQKPRAFFLGDYAVVSLENATPQQLGYKFKWSGESAWTPALLAPGMKLVHKLPVKVGQKSGVDFEIKFDGRTKTGKLTPNFWSGKGEPGFEDGTRTAIRFRTQ